MDPLQALLIRQAIADEMLSYFAETELAHPLEVHTRDNRLPTGMVLPNGLPSRALPYLPPSGYWRLEWTYATLAIAALIEAGKPMQLPERTESAVLLPAELPDTRPMPAPIPATA